MFNGKIVFDIADVNPLEVDFGTEIMPTKVINKDEVVTLGRKAPKNRWMYKITYNGERKYLESLDRMAKQLCKKGEYVNELFRMYEEVRTKKIYIRSEFAEIGYSIPNYILKRLPLLSCAINFKILSFGMAINTWQSA